jgi:hypothetical protein
MELVRRKYRKEKKNRMEGNRIAKGVKGDRPLYRERGNERAALRWIEKSTGKEKECLS